MFQLTCHFEVDSCPMARCLGRTQMSSLRLTYSTYARPIRGPTDECFCSWLVLFSKLRFVKVEQSVDRKPTSASPQV